MRSSCRWPRTWRSTSATTASASAADGVIRTEAAIGSCSACEIRSAATNDGVAVSSATIAISVGPASASMPTRPLTRRFAATT